MATTAKKIRDNIVASALAIKSWRERGLTVFEIAERFGRSVSWTKQRFVLRKLDPALYLLLNGLDPEQPGRKLSFSHALLLTSLPTSLQLETARTIIDKGMSLLAARRHLLGLRAKLQPSRKFYLRPAQQFETLQAAVVHCRATIGYYLEWPSPQFDRLLQPQQRQTRQHLLDELRSLASELEVFAQRVEGTIAS